MAAMASLMLILMLMLMLMLVSTAEAVNVKAMRTKIQEKAGLAPANLTGTLTFYREDIESLARQAGIFFSKVGEDSVSVDSRCDIKPGRNMDLTCPNFATIQSANMGFGERALGAASSPSARYFVVTGVQGAVTSTNFSGSFDQAMRLALTRPLYITFARDFTLTYESQEFSVKYPLTIDGGPYSVIISGAKFVSSSTTNLVLNNLVIGPCFGTCVTTSPSTVGDMLFHFVTWKHDSRVIHLSGAGLKATIAYNTFVIHASAATFSAHSAVKLTDTTAVTVHHCMFDLFPLPKSVFTLEENAGHMVTVLHAFNNIFDQSTTTAAAQPPVTHAIFDQLTSGAIISQSNWISTQYNIGVLFSNPRSVCYSASDNSRPTSIPWPFCSENDYSKAAVCFNTEEKCLSPLDDRKFPQLVSYNDRSVRTSSVAKHLETLKKYLANGYQAPSLVRIRADDALDNAVSFPITLKA